MKITIIITNVMSNFQQKNVRIRLTVLAESQPLQVCSAMPKELW